MIDRDDLARHYAALADVAITELAMYGARNLRSEALPVLKAEIQRRSLPEQFVDAVSLWEQGVSDEERARVLEWLRHQPCPLCGDTGTLLNAAEIKGVTSYLVASRVRSSLVVACSGCLEKEIDRIQETQALGRFGPVGFLRTTLAEASNEIARSQALGKEPSPALMAYVDLSIVPLCLMMRDGQAPFASDSTDD